MRFAGHCKLGLLSRQVALAACVGALVSSCAGSAGTPNSSPPRVLLLYGDGRPDAELSFADSAYEALIRFDLQPEQGVPKRLWYRPAAAGTLQISVYENSALDGPGAVIEQHERVVASDVDWTAPSGRWLVQEFTSLEQVSKPTTIWVGLKKLAEMPAVWCSDKDASHYYMRSSDPQRYVALVPVRRSPLVQLELLPEE